MAGNTVVFLTILGYFYVFGGDDFDYNMWWYLFKNVFFVFDCFVRCFWSAVCVFQRENKYRKNGQSDLQRQGHILWCACAREKLCRSCIQKPFHEIFSACMKHRSLMIFTFWRNDFSCVTCDIVTGHRTLCTGDSGFDEKSWLRVWRVQLPTSGALWTKLWFLTVWDSAAAVTNGWMDLIWTVIFGEVKSASLEIEVVHHM